MTVPYRVKYAVLPAGVGPDDYEPHELEKGETIVELPAPEPVGVISGGDVLSYGPPIPEVEKAVIAAAQLADGDEPIVLKVEPV